MAISRVSERDRAQGKKCRVSRPRDTTCRGIDARFFPRMARREGMTVHDGGGPRVPVIDYATRSQFIYFTRKRILEPAPPKGLSDFATATRAAGQDVRFLHLMVSLDPPAVFRAEFGGFKPDVVGFSLRARGS
jgi:hypothetical protein